MQYNRGKPKTSFLRMVLFGLVLVSPAFLAGLNQTYVAIALPQMQLNLSDASWFGSLGSFSAPISCALVGYLIDRHGRKAVLIYSIAASVIGWSLTLLDSGTTVTLAGQMFNGLTTGAVGYASQVYAGECVMVNDVRLRNSFLMWNGVGGSVGSTATLLMANFVDYRRIAAVGTLLSVALLVLLYRVIPESPTWLYCKGRIGDAEWSERRLGIAQPILSQRRHPARGDDVEAPVPVRVSHERVECWPAFAADVAKLRRADVYKPVLIFIGVNMLLATSGPSTLLTYMINIIENDVPGVGDNAAGDVRRAATTPTFFPTAYVPAYVWPMANVLRGRTTTTTTTTTTNVDQLTLGEMTSAANRTNATSSPTTTTTLLMMDAHQPTVLSSSSSSGPTEANAYSVIIGALMCATSVTSCCVLPYFGIRNILTTSSFCSSLAFVVLAITTTYAGATTAEALTWRVAAISMVAVLYSLSCGSSDAVLGDVLPADAKGFASIISVCSFLAVAVTNKAFPYLYALIGGHVYVLFTVVSILAVYVIRTFMPEVSGKTLDQINREFLKV